MGHALCVCSRGTVIIDNKRYLFIQKLGEGGFSYVDLVEGLHDGHFYALKRILCHEQQDREEAQREADMHRLFHHPNILRLVAYCLRERGAKHEAWLLLPFFKRGTLWNEIERLKDKGNFLTEDQILRLLLGICRGLEAIHTKGYAHRDLKPTNILLGDEGQPVLMDLGSMNQACIQVEGSRQALTLQLWDHCSRTGQPSGAPSPTGPRSSSLCRATVSSMNGLMSGHSSALRQLLASMMTVDLQQRPHIPLLLSQLEAMQPPAPGQHTTQI
ncbi:serine/threonine-protein kinase 16 isoform X2 [Marmota marmota marmota]|uniref:serine/threonine-protein kinase 16 isoform X2 n=1 Tax=Marmota marmota marmota TaxID=9994 RepID=UPI0020921ECC|nr:serine/threonine-protein kinase 16 isoform X2 [Marmota marmota marmota]